ncbi:iron chelate uptake ABC transporter family permease subunit [Actinoplanes bogorensis]|uniref:Iron chelate uptake ABC transporter family permease subunit n=1 Tax=Paractinoplanes bogorensis TaxID=1610840 RepID=A0ABS5YJS1_9ACTN|nr:iron chelate uptake ABC transporter family permease subunit [Actinoplanes bogorensis]
MDFGRRTLWARLGPVSLRLDVRSLAVCAVLAALSLSVALVALASGDFRLSVSEVVSAVLDRQSFAHTIVVDWRMPRVLAALVFGAALGVSGAIFQSLTRNPLASPDIIGFSTGAYTGALLVMVLAGGSYLRVAGGALAGGLATAALVYLLAYRRGVQGFRLIIVGIAVAATLNSFNTWLMLTADLEVAMAAATWGIGSLNDTGWAQAGLGGVVIGVLLLVAVPLARPLRQLELGDDAARARGVAVEPARLALVALGVALTAAVSAAAGPIVFVALAAGQISRRLTRTAGVALAPAAFLGALMLCACDYVAQHVLPTPLPVGVVTVVLGGGYLIWLLIHESRRRL